LELNKIRGGGVDVAVFANNLFDKTFRDYTANGVYPAGGFSLTHYNPPRMYGVEVTAHF
jgi:outer membrane receptor protein involved in Fe transport